MIFNKSTYNLILASIFAFLLSACAQQTAKIDSQIQAAIIQKAIKISENDLRQQLTEEKDEELIMSYLVEVKKDVISNS